MNKSIKTSPYTLLLASLVGLPSLAEAHHAEFMTAEPFLQGISMPIHGLDHMLVTIAVGLIAAQLGGNALWAIPGIFSVFVLLGGIHFYFTRTALHRIPGNSLFAGPLR